ncbi:MAG: glycosyltransferase family 4 protein, partial [Planctomycetota bacterium]|jgi:glycosyltransferase involved in cell wall biosynthesis
MVREKEAENVEVIRCHVSPSYNKSFIGRFWAYLSFTFSSILAGLFCVGKCDVVICTSPPLSVGLTGWILSKLKRIPMVFEVRDLWPESAISTGVLTNKWMISLGYWLERLSYRNSAWINVLTPAFEEYLVSRKDVRREIISMIPNGADLDLIKPGHKNNWVREKYALEGKFVVLYVGAHGVANHLIQILETARLLQNQEDILFMLVGDGMQKPALKEETTRCNLKNVIFVDSVPKKEIVDYISASDVCTAVLKKVDTFKTVYPNKVFDYMAAARPVIIGIDGVARKLIEDADAGIYVEPENASDFAEAVLRLRNDPQLCNRYGGNGLKFVSEYFARSVLAEKYIDILNNNVVLKKKRG